MINSYFPHAYHQPSFYPAQSIPSPYYASPPMQQPQPQQQQYKTPMTSYVGSTLQNLPPRRQPRIIRQVIMLPTPAPIYRQVRHRLPTPERQVIQRTVVQKANGDVIVEQQRPVYQPRTQSRSEAGTKTRSSRSRQVNTDWYGSLLLSLSLNNHFSNHSRYFELWNENERIMKKIYLGTIQLHRLSLSFCWIASGLSHASVAWIITSRTQYIFFSQV